MPIPHSIINMIIAKAYNTEGKILLVLIECVINEIYISKYPNAPVNTAIVFIFLLFIYIKNNRNTIIKLIINNITNFH